MRTLLTLPAFLTFGLMDATSANAQALFGPTSVQTCADWNHAQANPKLKTSAGSFVIAIGDTWVLGFIYGAEYARHKDDHKGTYNVKPNSILDDVSKLCAQHPSERLSSIVKYEADELDKHVIDEPPVQDESELEALANKGTRIDARSSTICTGRFIDGRIGGCQFVGDFAIQTINKACPNHAVCQVLTTPTPADGLMRGINDIWSCDEWGKAADGRLFCHVTHAHQRN
jgi:hypothetical protein